MTKSIFHTSDPLSASIELTRQCTLKCIHCYNFSSPQNKRHFNLSGIKNRIDDIAVLDIPAIWLTGGEPTILEELGEIILFAHSRGLKVNLSTNGCFGTEMASRLADLPLQNVRVSLDGYQEDNDYIRGDGLFKKALNGLNCMNRLNVPGSIALHIHRGMKLSPTETIVKLLDFTDSIHVGPVLPFGRARSLQHLCMSEDEFAKLPIGSVDRPDSITISDGRCSALNGIIALDSLGRQILCCLRNNIIVSNYPNELNCKKSRLSEHIPAAESLSCFNCKL